MCYNGCMGFSYYPGVNDDEQEGYDAELARTWEREQRVPTAKPLLKLTTPKVPELVIGATR